MVAARAPTAVACGVGLSVGVLVSDVVVVGVALPDVVGVALLVGVAPASGG